jgi:hypothetical protein
MSENIKTAEELLKELKEKVNIRDQMGGTLYWNILNDKACTLANECLEAGINRQEIEELLGKGNFR